MAAALQANFDIDDTTDPHVNSAVMAELNRLLSHPLLKDTTRMKRFLKYIVTETLAGRGSLIKGYSLGLEVFDRSDDFDPQADTIVRVQAGQLRRRLDLIYGSDDTPINVRIVVPKGQYAPVFEMRNDAEQPESKSNLALISNEAATETEEKLLSRPGVAVTTLENLSISGDGDYFAEGLTAELINALVQFRYLRIVTLTPTISSRAGFEDVKALADQYNVQFFLSGSVRQSGDVFRISINLIEAETGQHIFTKVMDRQYSSANLFDVQEEIASHTAAAVAAPYGVINRYNRRQSVQATRSIPAYEAILKYYSLTLRPTQDQALELLKEFEALSLTEPDHSSIWAIMSILNSFIASQVLRSDEPEKYLETALNAATRAASIDPQNSLAFFALFLAYHHSGEVELGEKMVMKALHLNPNDDAVLAYVAVTQAFMGNCAVAITYLNAATDLNPRPPKWYYLTTIICAYDAGKFEDVCDLLGELDIDQMSAVTMLHLASLGHLGRKDKAKSFLKTVMDIYPNFRQDCLKLMSYWSPDKKLIDSVLLGWDKIGLKG